MIRGLYNYLLAPVLLAGYRAFAAVNVKARQFFQVREGMFERLTTAREALGERPLILFHVASVGELLEALPVMKALADRSLPPLIALAHTSSSVSNHLPRDLRADLVTPAPLDRRREVEQFLDLMRPSLIIFSSYDLWPNLVWEASDRGVHLALINGRLPSVAGRLKWPARVFFRSVYHRLDAAGAIDKESAESFPHLGVPLERVAVTGNCRFDQTLARCRSVSADDPDLIPIPPGGFTFIAGSTWPQDHEHLLPALSTLMKKHDDLTAVVAPHEPSPRHLAEIEDYFHAVGISTHRYQDLRDRGEECPSRVLVVDTVGVLYKLYRRGRAAYVGGSFRQGVHNVMEPAGMGLPVLVGPVHHNSPEAEKMIGAGGAREVTGREDLEQALAGWLDSGRDRERAGAAALAMVEGSAGAAGRTLELLAPLLIHLK